jgi:hypothetical protein
MTKQGTKFTQESKMFKHATRFLMIAGYISITAAVYADAPSLGDLAKSKASVHRFSTLFTSHTVKNRLDNEAGLAAAVAWCRATGVTKVYLESFRDGYQADRAVLENAKKRFLAEGFVVSGCVTTTKVGKKSSGWDVISCFTDQATQENLQKVFEFEASLFDEIMIDDFWFTDCKCPACDAARLAKKAAVGDSVYPVAGDTWEDYRCELMTRVSQHRILEAAKRVNPNVRIIIKYPEWYDEFHERGYEVIRETAAFDRIWVGTETRDYAHKMWGGKPPYAAYFIMRWLGGIGGPKCGGGWYDPLGTAPATYIEQARQTVLAGATESMLFAYDCLLQDTGPKDIEALRANIPDLLLAADIVHGRQPVGVAAYKPANSHPDKEVRVFDFVGMLGIPLVPCHEFPVDAKAAFFSVHAMKDPAFPQKLAAFIASGKPTLVTDGLAGRLAGKVQLDAANVRVLPVKGNPRSLLAMPQKEADAIRQPLLRTIGHEFQAPASVGLYVFDSGSWVIENFNDQPVTVRLDGKDYPLSARQWRVNAAK